MDDNIIELEVGSGPQQGEYTVRVLQSVTGGEPTGTFGLDVEELLGQRPQIEATVLSSSSVGSSSDSGRGATDPAHRANAV